jgi:hypothetical protein
VLYAVLKCESEQRATNEKEKEERLERKEILNREDEEGR